MGCARPAAAGRSGSHEPEVGRAGARAGGPLVPGAGAQCRLPVDARTILKRKSIAVDTGHLSQTGRRISGIAGPLLSSSRPLADADREPRGDVSRVRGPHSRTRRMSRDQFLTVGCDELVEHENARSHVAYSLEQARAMAGLRRPAARRTRGPVPKPKGALDQRRGPATGRCGRTTLARPG